MKVVLLANPLHAERSLLWGGACPVRALLLVRYRFFALQRPATLCLHVAPSRLSPWPSSQKHSVSRRRSLGRTQFLGERLFAVDAPLKAKFQVNNVASTTKRCLAGLK